jgi:hypothetical protein
MQTFDGTTGSGGWTGVGWMGASSGPWFGRFHCTWYDKFGDGQTWAATCTHGADRHVGRIVVQFVIQGQEIGAPDPE